MTRQKWCIVQLSRAETQGVELTPFMALRGNPHDYWFLDGDFIDRGEID